MTSHGASDAAASIEAESTPTALLPVSHTWEGGARGWRLREGADGRMCFEGKVSWREATACLAAAPIVWWLTNSLGGDVRLAWGVSAISAFAGLGLLIGGPLMAQCFPRVDLDVVRQSIQWERRSWEWRAAVAVQVIEFVAKVGNSDELRYQWNLVLTVRDKLERRCLVQAGSPDQLLHDARRMADYLGVPLQEHWLAADEVRPIVRRWMLPVALFGIGGILWLVLLVAMIWSLQPVGRDALFFAGMFVGPAGFLSFACIGWRAARETLLRPRPEASKSSAVTDSKG